MCVNYQPPKREELIEHFQVDIDADATWPAETWQDYPAPIIRHGAQGERQAVIGTYGMVPRRHIPEGVKPYSTLNGRAESIGEKRSFSKAWRSGHTCLTPMWKFYEPNYEQDEKKSVRWSITLIDHAPFAVAGLWREWREMDDSTAVAFTQLTVNADSHPFMKRFHKRDAEKRSLVIVKQDDYDAWLACRDPEVARSFLSLYPAELMTGEPAPQAPRRTKQKSHDE